MFFHTHQIVSNSFLHSFLQNSVPNLLYIGHSHAISLSAISLSQSVRHSANLGALTHVRSVTEQQGTPAWQSEQAPRPPHCWHLPHPSLSLLGTQAKERLAMLSCIWASSLCTQGRICFPHWIWSSSELLLEPSLGRQARNIHSIQKAEYVAPFEKHY